MSSKRRWTNEQLIEAVKTSTAIYQVAPKLGLKPNGSYKIIKSYISKLGLDTSHFMATPKERTEYAKQFQKKKTLEELLVSNGNYNDSNLIKPKLKKSSLLAYECSVCKLQDMWQNLPLTLQLDHINGDHCDNRIENLRWICPNCHSQTSNFCGRKNRKTPIKNRKPRRSTAPRPNKTRPNKIVWPSIDELTKRCHDIGYRALGRELGVSDNAIRKRIKKNGGSPGE